LDWTIVQKFYQIKRKEKKKSKILKYAIFILLKMSLIGLLLLYQNSNIVMCFSWFICASFTNICQIDCEAIIHVRFKFQLCSSLPSEKLFFNLINIKDDSLTGCLSILRRLYFCYCQGSLFTYHSLLWRIWFFFAPTKSYRKNVCGKLVRGYSVANYILYFPY